jgi:hypothetical protein
MTATADKARAWAIRTDRAHREDLILPEVRSGVLRQGWGYDRSQNLRRIRGRLNGGVPLDDVEQDAWARNRRLLPDEPDGVAAGDWLVLPNLPHDGVWTIARAGDSYEFAISKTGDHGHCRTINILAEGINPRELEMPAGLRRTTRCQRSMWNIDAYRPDLERLVAAGPRRLPVASAIEAVVAAARAGAWAEFARHFSGAELEEPIAEVLEALYRRVERRGGPTEFGADLVCESVDPLGVPSRVAVQVKMWSGVAADTSPIEQLARSFEALPGITAGVVMTTADSCSADFIAAAKSLQQQAAIPVRVLTRDAVLNLILGTGIADSQLKLFGDVNPGTETMSSGRARGLVSPAPAPIDHERICA